MTAAVPGILALLVGLALVARWRRPGDCGPFPAGFLVALGGGLGLGVTSLLWFWTRALSDGRVSSLWVDLVLVVVLAVACPGLRALPGVVRQAVGGLRSLRPRPLAVLGTAAVPGFLAICAAAALASGTATPHGGWDAWAIWNLRARLLFRGVPLDEVLSELLWWSHPEYPLLLPGAVVRHWTFLGAETPFVPILVALFFTLGTALLLDGGMSRLVAPAWGVFGVVLLVAHPRYLEHGVSQYADTPLSFFVLAALVLFALADASGGRGLPADRSRLVALAGLAAGLAAWTKEEGLLFVVVLAAVRLGAGLARRDLGALGREATAFGLGLLPTALTLGWFRALAPSGWLADQTGEALASRLAEGERWATVLRAFGAEYRGVGPVLAGMAAVAVLALLRRRPRTRGAPTVLATVAAMHVGYGLVYVVTPFPLEWHLESSLPRLVLQVWPALVLGFLLLAAAAPDETARELVGDEARPGKRRRRRRHRGPAPASGPG